MVAQILGWIAVECRSVTILQPSTLRMTVQAGFQAIVNASHRFLLLVAANSAAPADSCEMLSDDPISVDRSALIQRTNCFRIQISSICGGWYGQSARNLKAVLPAIHRWHTPGTRLTKSVTGFEFATNVFSLCHCRFYRTNPWKNSLPALICTTAPVQQYCKAVLAGP